MPTRLYGADVLAYGCLVHQPELVHPQLPVYDRKIVGQRTSGWQKCSRFFHDS